MSKNVCKYCRLGILKTEQCYAGGWCSCYGEKFEPRVKEAEVNLEKAKSHLREIARIVGGNLSPDCSLDMHWQVTGEVRLYKEHSDEKVKELSKQFSLLNADNYNEMQDYAHILNQLKERIQFLEEQAKRASYGDTFLEQIRSKQHDQFKSDLRLLSEVVYKAVSDFVSSNGVHPTWWESDVAIIVANYVGIKSI